MFIGTSAIEFAKMFPDNDSCYRLLDTLKWKDGYKCYKCGCTHYGKGRTQYHRRCQDCGYDESLTANTLFHDIRMPIRKAFYMIFNVGTKVKGMSTAELARQVGVQQRTGWLFKRKIQVAMQRSASALSFFELLLSSLNQLIEKAKSRTRDKKRSGKNDNHGAGLSQNEKAPAGKAENGRKNRRPFIRFINFLGLKKHNWAYPGTSNQQILFNSWLGGVHHQCSEALYTCYCDEFAYRFDRREAKDNIFSQLLTDMLRTKPHPYSMLKLTRE